MDLWQSLVSAALMGTERQAPAVSEEGDSDALTTLVQQLDWQQPESSLLGAAGAIALHRQVGQNVSKPELPELVPCAVEGSPVAPASSAPDSSAPDFPNNFPSNRTRRYLRTALETETRVLPELLRLMAEANQLVPVLLLPKLLGWGEQNEAVRPQIVQVLGDRGRWLAAQNPAWHYGLAQVENFDPESAEVQTLWQEGDRQVRRLLLQRWRKANAEEARLALEAVWSQELAKERDALIQALAVNLSMADEPFLEAALSDRAQGVRAQARTLLAQLSPSRFCQRMAERSRAFVKVLGTGSTLNVEVTLPNTFEQEWGQDGIEQKAPKGQGQKAWWLEQLLAYTPLEVWDGRADEALGRTPSEACRAIAQALKGHDWRDPLLQGWSLAALRQHNVDWGEALVEPFGLQRFDPEVLTELLKQVPTQRCETLLQVKLPPPSAKPETLIQCLQQMVRCEKNWSLSFSQDVLELFVSVIRTQRRKSYQLFYLLDDLAFSLHLDVAPLLHDAITSLSQNKHDSYLHNNLEQLYHRLKFRQDIHKAFDASG